MGAVSEDSIDLRRSDLRRACQNAPMTDFNQIRLLILVVAGWIGREQADAIQAPSCRAPAVRWAGAGRTIATAGLATHGTETGQPRRAAPIPSFGESRRAT